MRGTRILCSLLFGISPLGETSIYSIRLSYDPVTRSRWLCRFSFAERPKLRDDSLPKSEMCAILMIIEDIIEKQSHKVPRTVNKLVLAVALSQN